MNSSLDEGSNDERKNGKKKKRKKEREKERKKEIKSCDEFNSSLPQNLNPRLEYKNEFGMPNFSKKKDMTFFSSLYVRTISSSLCVPALDREEVCLSSSSQVRLLRENEKKKERGKEEKKKERKREKTEGKREREREKVGKKEKGGLNYGERNLPALTRDRLE